MTQTHHHTTTTMPRLATALALAALACVAPTARAVFDWGEMSNQASKQQGDATFYGQDPDQVREIGKGGGKGGGRK